MTIVKILTLSGYCSAAGLYFLGSHRHSLPDFWLKQAAYLFASAGILSLCLYWVKRIGAVSIILLLQFGILLLVCYPEGGTRNVAGILMMGIGQVVTLEVPADKVRMVNLAIEKSAWGAFKTEFYLTYDFLPVLEKKKAEAARRSAEKNGGRKA